LSAKWLELLKEVAPDVTRVAVLREPGLTAAIAQFAALQAVAPSLRMELVPLNFRDQADIERVVASFARSQSDGMIVTSGPLAAVHRKTIIATAARHKLPAVYVSRFTALDGGLISYGPDFVDQFRGAATYVDRILKGEKPADLPVQAPTKYELVVNLKAAKALGLSLPPSLLARANEVVE
jgi:putative ABC transport system substrate-binding protein